MSDATQHQPFGTYRLPRSFEWLRQRSGELPNGRIGRAGASLIRRVIASRGPGVYDVEVFPTIHARLYPATNTCERRVFTAAQFFDAEERAFLDSAVATSPSSTFVFFDLGANVGLYGLSVLSSARAHQRDVKVIAVEPDPTTRSRLLENIAFSNAADKFIVESCGVGADRGVGGMVAHANNRGQNRITTGGSGATGQIEILPLFDICQRHGITSIDAVKIDVEGMDFDVLEAFFAAAPSSLYPGSIIVEVDKTGAKPAVVALCEKSGYQVAQRTRMNAIVTRAETAMGHL